MSLSVGGEILIIVFGTIFGIGCLGLCSKIKCGCDLSTPVKECASYCCFKRKENVQLEHH